MPLVTRSSVQGNLYRQAAAPAGPNTGDVWVDTDTGAISTYNGAAWVLQTAGALGTANQIVRVNAGATALEYGSPLVLTRQLRAQTADFTTTSGTFVDVTGLTLTLANRTNGMSLVLFMLFTRSSVALDIMSGRIVDDETGLDTIQNQNTVTLDIQAVTDFAVVLLSGQAVKYQVGIFGGVNTLTIMGAGNAITKERAWEIS